MAMNVGPNPGSADETDDGEWSGDERRLPCGRELADVWRQWEEGPEDPHARTCPHCTAALRELDQLEDVVRQTRMEEPPGGDASMLVERVMDVVRLELRPGRTLPLGTPAEDHWIVEAAAAKVFRAAADSLPGVRARSCHIIPPGRGAAASQRTRGPVSVSIEVVVAVTADLQRVAQQVRERVLAVAETALGMEVGSIDVAVADVYGDEIPQYGGPR
ncbi:Asp23/Gls24 family envelope stress response protein [Streptomyces sp. AK02-04a]|uniref:Asp23/Gls24 family envelope stress response protein n=1 Tax=Streptomyces sp. AK02-04a TaxID=3028649 RepID=UPI0029BB66D3|nr:Asp23/Gls24 family envelope stress response protein [Streptomyces sp. AK02-04a]MDX3763397.1 Asp23/Gls24 family envelope stress response protein [Streptomyces sp. AK02-04a]